MCSFAVRGAVPARCAARRTPRSHRPAAARQPDRRESGVDARIVLERSRRRRPAVSPPLPDRARRRAAGFPGSRCRSASAPREVKRISSIERRGRNPARCSARIASSPPSTPTVPSKRPALGMASIASRWPTGGSLGSRACQRANVLPTASSRTSSPPRAHSASCRLARAGPLGKDDAGHRRSGRSENEASSRVRAESRASASPSDRGSRSIPGCRFQSL